MWPYLLDSDGKRYDATKYIHKSLISEMINYEKAPDNHREACDMGPKWAEAELKELHNHHRNLTWQPVLASEVPRDRRIHKLVWVYKVKRDGTAKARLCVQGCTMIPGQDFVLIRYSPIRFVPPQFARYSHMQHAMLVAFAVLIG